MSDMDSGSDMDLSPDADIGNGPWQDWPNSMADGMHPQGLMWATTSTRFPSPPDSPPYEQPATRLDMARFRRSFPIITGERYVHIPDRRDQRSMPTPTNIRTCIRCGLTIVPYVPGMCPNCWRFREPVYLDGVQCACLCTCPPEPDDDADEDYVPDEGDSDEEIDVSQAIRHTNSVNQTSNADDRSVDSSTDNDVTPALLADTILYNLRGNIIHRPLYAENVEHYAAAIGPQDPADASSSLWNPQNAMTELEVSRLYRAPFRLELARMLDLGYTRNDLRDRFQETGQPWSTAYLPSDRFSYGQAPATCWYCRRNYSTQLRDALTMGQIRNMAVNDLNLPVSMRNRPRLVRARNIVRHWREVRRVPYVHLCRTCRKPQYAPGPLSGGINDCHCHCECVDMDTIPVAPTSSESSNESDVIPGYVPRTPQQG